MTKKWMIYIVVILLVSLTGCDVLKNMALGKPLFQKKTAAAPVEEKPLIEYIQSPELAKIILKPEKKPLSVSRDPFKPLIAEEINAQGQDNSVSPLAEPANLDDVALIGVVKFGSEVRAYLKMSNKTGIFKVGDTLRNYVINQIDSDRVIFKSGNSEIEKKREDIKRK